MPEPIHPGARKLLRISLWVFAVLMYWLPGGTSLAQEAQRETLVATVTDVKGDATTVIHLKGRYVSPSETRPAGFPGYVYRTESSTEQLPKLEIELELKEGRTTWKEEIAIPFSELRQISFDKSGPIGNYLKVLLERRDGSRIVMERTKPYETVYDTFEERDSRGEVKRVIKPGLGGIAVRSSFKERSYLLEGFEGRARTSTGVEGNFYIELSQVRTITFK